MGIASLDERERDAMRCDVCHLHEMNYVIEAGSPEGILLGWCGECDSSGMVNSITNTLKTWDSKIQYGKTGTPGELSM